MVDETSVAPAPVFAPGHEHLSGSHPRTLDEKARAVLPAGGWREVFASGAKLGPYVDRLALWTARSWAFVTGEIRTQERMGLLPDGAYDDFVADAVDVTPDAQGRLVLPEALRRRVGIADKGAEVVLVGQGHHVEIWAKRHHDEVRGARDVDAAAKAVQALKI